jgi:hypothetical protein
MRYRSGASLLQALAVVVVVAALGLLTWTTIANWRHDGAFSLRVFDGAWWSRPWSDQPDGKKPSLVDRATSVAERAKENLWGPGGLVERCEQWWNGRAPAAGAPRPADEREPPKLKIERALDQAERHFRAGLDALKRSAPSAPGPAADKRRHVSEAHDQFTKAGELLAASLPAYRAFPDRDPGIESNAIRLQEYNQRMLEITAPAPMPMGPAAPSQEPKAKGQEPEAKDRR